MPKHVILGRTEHEHPPKDAWHQFEGLVVVLVAIHALAFLFWAWLLYKTRRAGGNTVKAVAGAGAGAGSGARSGKWSKSSGGSGPPAATSPRRTAPAFEWRTPREILAQQRAKAGGKV
ncbi:hypothetical protein GPECTOR_252g632 [Gonium pectorale]|uniref:Uncharacterized protein n=1 Tax=Gonium pectorale TaxID=33097 RepID=A0A150FXG3_GONPE|nr:hypothetical protein GPECTOR_252g632 [Gonium pectorale]|eukprot:KXZ41885.1 hypothetical protein GPECTOR_252g632 [Gonium pectorale]